MKDLYKGKAPSGKLLGAFSTYIVANNSLFKPLFIIVAEEVGFCGSSQQYFIANRIKYCVAPARIRPAKAELRLSNSIIISK
ncbi:MAG: hypothetical protein A2653_03215 [Candidatus Zambryskibacteria bacterium RIFCSPHIGHO2_01_FULL_43_25]|uniref:Uncharacterized protein n=1 Tax=Candidatus Zambryskibacteria bacterium RIFCSPLOWO2_01_FULL_45_21 TaxID=1802761 RepID=A0A1G2U577_9BACT|nr:MAG: hypothetical protein A2653_03215 [Candidatus Zambryskibacteria bacterium RIFCSPHIGHO2_01_FULL_43_25]OHB00622.1 MAG: hypothetical protein A3E94_03240 [Candidatus Zambryskibacteria bacterium RIFCSPHIGHO2_12_FULL_44_12b]OHB04647.1 MAG: hypothetical protein A3B14_01600 [Candidatus Zambryskibacteria bacterium RIFCSPLOWO2_01_FULL_45_21]